jgi:hypothetical protein
MNEKIKQLWDNSIEEFSKQHQYATIMLPEPLREKFAELIVQECIEVVEKQKAKMSYGPTFVIEDIKQHFGVKE